MDSVRNFNTVGILGGGQLAMMLAEAAKALNNPPLVWGDAADNSAQKFASEFSFGPVSGSYSFFENVGIVTLESEFFDEETLMPFKDRLIPKLEHYLELETKLKEKKLFKAAGFKPIPHSQNFDNIKDFPIMLKLSSGGYDGHGNFMIKSGEDLQLLLPKLMDQDIFWEPFLEIKRELATQVVSDGDHVVVYPFVQTIQENSICVEVKLLNESFPQLENKIIDFIKQKKYKGTLAFEFIETDDGIYFNETAPRVHNSGHYTADLCKTGQFENHMRICLGLSPAEVEMIHPHGGMLNILCKNWDQQSEILKAIKLEKTHYVDYLKSPRAGRKMGHINYWGNSQSEADTVRKELLELLGEN